MKKNILIIVLLFVTAVLVIASFYSWFGLSKAERVAKESRKPNTDSIELKKYLSALGKDTVYITSYEANKGEALANNVTKNYYTYVADTLAPALKIATEKISELQQIKATLEGTVKAQRQEIDKEKNLTVFYKDKYFSATTKTDTLGNASMSYNYNAQLNIVTETKQRFLKKDLQTIYITSPDKNLKINGVEHFKREVYIKPKNIGFGLQGGYYYVPSENRFVPAVGVGVSYNLIRL